MMEHCISVAPCVVRIVRFINETDSGLLFSGSYNAVTGELKIRVTKKRPDGQRDIILLGDR